MELAKLHIITIFFLSRVNLASLFIKVLPSIARTRQLYGKVVPEIQNQPLLIILWEWVACFKRRFKKSSGILKPM